MAQRTCARCGELFEVTRSHPTKKFCTPACQVAQNRAEKTAKRQAAKRPLVPLVCRGCEQTYTPTERWQRWCSVKCGSRIRQRGYKNLRGPGSIARPCGYCTTEFSSVDARQLYCSGECARTAKSLRQAFRLYGITMRQYRTIWLRQNGLCVICKQPERTERNRLLTVDHDHVSGHFRGLLCSHCNRAIGLLRDDPGIIEAAARYVRESRQLKLVIA